MKNKLMLTNESITFGKYKGKTLGHVLKDRGYCDWLKEQDWFQESYEYLYNRICEYDPRSYFLNSSLDNCTNFLSDYEFFNLRDADDVELPLTSSEKMCYIYYIKIIDFINNLKKGIQYENISHR